MQGRGFSLRWIVLAAVAIFVCFFFASLLVGRYESAGSGFGAGLSLFASSTSTPPANPVDPGTPAAIPSPTATPGSLSRPAPSATPTVAPTPVTSPADLLYPVNKQTAIPASFEPPDLVALTSVRTTIANQKIRRVALPSLEKMLADARSLGYELAVTSAYRSYGEQEQVHAYWERTLGKAEADRVSARAGYSEHQLGTTVDLTSASVGFDLTERFGNTPEGRWLRENAHRYGFVISYPAGKEAVTGYAYEPWHLRYVTVEHATAIYQKGTTLEEYLRSRR